MSVASRKYIETALLSTPRILDGIIAQPIGAAVLVEPRAHFGMAVTEPAGRNTNSDADRKAPFG